MSGLLEADIDLGLESGAAAFDPLPAVHHHRDGWFPPPAADTPLSRRAAQSSRPFHMSHLVPSRIPASRLAPAGASGDPLFAFSFRVSRSLLGTPPHPPFLRSRGLSACSSAPSSSPPSSSPRIPSFSHGSAILGVLFCLVPSIPRASPSRSPGTPVPSPLSRRERAPSPLSLRTPPRLSSSSRPLPPFSREFVSRDGGRKIVHPTCLDSLRLRPSPSPLLFLPLNPGFRQWPRVQSTRPSARRRYRFHTDRASAGVRGWGGKSGRAATLGVLARISRRIRASSPREGGVGRDGRWDGSSF